MRKRLDLIIYFLVWFLWSLFNFSVSEVVFFFHSSPHLTLSVLDILWQVQGRCEESETAAAAGSKPTLAKSFWGSGEMRTIKSTRQEQNFVLKIIKRMRKIQSYRCLLKCSIFFMANLHSGAYKWNIMFMFFYTQMLLTCVSAETLMPRHAVSPIKYGLCV